MKIIMACEIYPPDVGGPATFAGQFSLILQQARLNFSNFGGQAGYGINLITYADSSSSADGVIRILRRKNLLLRYWHYFRQLKKLARGADLIFAQGPVAAGLPAVLVKKLTGKKVIIKVAGDVAWEKAVSRGWTKESIDDFQKNRPGLKINFLKFLRQWTTSRADLVIVPSQYLKKLVSGWGVRPEKIKVILNSFEARPIFQDRAMAKQKLNLQGDIILSVGRLASWKGFGTLIDLMPVFLMLNRQFKLLIVGSGPEENNLKLKAKNLKLQDRVIFAGQKSQAEMPLYYNVADLFVLNTAYEGLSHTLLEALSYHLPIITTRIGGNPEVIENGENGLLVEYNNQQQLLEAVKNVWQQPALKEKFKQNAQRTLEKFAFDRMVSEYLEVLK